MSWLGILNRVMLQWFFIRLTKHMRMGESGEWEIDHWSLQGWITPLTGWRNEYKYLGGHPRFFRL